MMMFELIGYKIHYEYGSVICIGEKIDEETIVATFDTEKQARKYIKAARLKNPHSPSPFRQKSLLSYYDSADVKESDPEETPPHNPEI